MFLSPTMGTYQSINISKKRIKQVTTKRPMKIRFCGLTSKGTSPKNSKCQISKSKVQINQNNFKCQNSMKILELIFPFFLNFGIHLTFGLWHLSFSS